MLETETKSRRVLLMLGLVCAKSKLVDVPFTRAKHTLSLLYK